MRCPKRSAFLHEFARHQKGANLARIRSTDVICEYVVDLELPVVSWPVYTPAKQVVIDCSLRAIFQLRAAAVSESAIRLLRLQAQYVVFVLAPNSAFPDHESNINRQACD